MSQIQLKWPYFLSSIYSKGHKASVCGLKKCQEKKNQGLHWKIGLDVFT